MKTISAPHVIGVGLKMYLDVDATLQWAHRVKDIVANHPAVASGAVEVFVLPSFPMIRDMVQIFSGSGVGVGAQNFSNHDEGPYTGEVSPLLLKQIGCEYAEVGHFERRSNFNEDEALISKKVSSAFRNDLIPVICIGEYEELDPEETSSETIRQLKSSLSNSGKFLTNSPVVVAYEPSWAIGGAAPASAQHINAVCLAIRDELIRMGAKEFWVIYGGSAGPGLYASISDSVDGLFLGRLAHDPESLSRVLDEVWVEEKKQKASNS